MRIQTLTLTLFLPLLLGGGNELSARQLAFPTAEGAGCYVVGGRGGAVYEVTTLEDNEPGSSVIPGSLRAAVNATGARTVVFRVSGTITLKSEMKIRNPYITIAGQTAPGEGVCNRGYQVEIQTDQVIIRYMRFRLGDETGVDTDAIWGRYRKNIIIDHCTSSWSVDEAMSFYGNDSMTVQWCLVSESLYMSNHPKGAHGYGGIWGGKNVTFHHNLLVHHSSRNPRFAGGETTTCENVDFRNNVIYNWGFNSAYGGEGGKINMVANYFKAGPATKSGVRSRIVEPSDTNGKWYIEENYMDEFPNITSDNWAGGVQGGNAVASLIRVSTPFPFVPITVQSAEEAYLSVLENVGANFPKRDTVDARIISDVRTGTATFDGRWYEINQNMTDTLIVRGIIDSQKNVGGWPVLLSLPAANDNDHDGMPDEWELARGLNPNDNSDRNLVDASGYTMLETYLNGLVGETPDALAERVIAPTTFTVSQNYPNPFNPSTTLAFSLSQPGEATIAIYDLTGRLVKNLFKSYCGAGSYRLQWNGEDEFRQRAPSGIYFCEMRIGNRRQMIKMQLIR